MSIISPIIIAEGLDVSIFPSAEQVLAYVEAIDVEENIYVAFDSTGKHLQLTLDGKDIKIKISDKNHFIGLHELLIDFLVAVGDGSKVGLQSKTLDELIQLAIKNPVTKKNISFWETIKNLFSRVSGK